MADGCKLTKTNKGYIITTPSGDRIPNIAKDSIKITQDNEAWISAGLCRVTVELLIWRKDMQGID